VWALWSDPDNWSRWNTGIRSSRIDGSLASGATGTMQTTRGSTHAVAFADVEPPTRFTMRMAGPLLTTITFRCETVADAGGSIVSQSVVFSGPLGFLFGSLMGNQLAGHFEPVLADLSSAAERSNTERA
jgi:uncharacterized protein YndB with AHSA1/START domain